ncbi:MAG TPA: hypothetical protein PLA53_00875 [bacterium]|jgi:hypothetical protein|nr:hypothetical protein [bacterium]HNZ51440.1 hypothetical protein [bacterium]HOF79379.1 hypothetical protein [bacterium]HOH85597.1 hypothetical protein [bacterium]HOQ91498.1 hypothetical protein [bacterium]
MLEQFRPQDSQRESQEATTENKVGLSLSLCIKNILEGKVKEEEVKEIIAGTSFAPEKFDELIDLYKKSYWYDNPEEGEAIARRLFAAGKIKQPRMEGGKIHSIAEGHWLDAEDAEEEYKKRIME